MDKASSDSAPASGPSFAGPSPRTRQSLFYALLFAGTGASMPFIPVWLTRNGMTPEQTGLILAVPLLARAVTGPLTGLWAERFERYRSPILILAMLGAAAYALMLPGRAYGDFAFEAFIVLYLVGYTCINNISPLLDSMTLQLARTGNFSQSSARAWGSAAFVIANVTLGVVLQWSTTQIVLIWIVSAALGLAICGRGLLLPQPRVRHEATERDGGGFAVLTQLFRNKGFLWLLLATGCLQAAHGFYYAFSTIIWQEQRGYSSTICGLLWAAAVAGEILFLAFASRLRHKLGPWVLLIIAGIAGVVRWALMMSLAPLWLLWILQLLHGFTFAAAYIAGLELIFHLTPGRQEGIAQTVNAAYTTGLMAGLVTLVSGNLYEFAGARAYGAMALLALVGLLAAVRLYLRRAELSHTRAGPAHA
jgi:PPP family 3-phenylpropionic acid transporter